MKAFKEMAVLKETREKAIFSLKIETDEYLSLWVS